MATSGDPTALSTNEAARSTRTLYRRLRPTIGLVISLIFVVVVGFLMFAPLIWMFFGGLKSEGEVVSIPPTLFPKDWLWSNFDYVMQTSPIGRGYLNSMIVVPIILVVQLVTSIVGGYVFAKVRFPGREPLFVGILSTLMIPAFLVEIPLFVVMVQLNWLNTYAALVVPHLFTAFGIFLMRQFMEGVPTEYIESARLDGCSEWGVIGRIVFPLVREPAAALAIFVFVYHWNDLFWPLLVMRQQSMYTLPLALYYIQGGYGRYYHLVLASATLAVVPVVIVYALLQENIIKGVALTGLKG
jgi:multiple sugar transport system permease protein